MKQLLSLFAAVIMLMVLAMNVSLAAGQAATGQLKDKEGKILGTVTLTQNNEGGVKLEVNYSNLPAGPHGIHFHAVGKCEGPDFASAGGHFNPDSHKHGLQTAEGGHAGDLPNLVVPAGGNGAFEATSMQITLGEGPHQLIGQQGAALVIHAAADDEKTDPSGNSGARIACAVLNLQPANLPASGLGNAFPTPEDLLWSLPLILALLAALALGSLLVFRRTSRR
jgi:superoxide dismutase, Cu-Zn family